MMPRLIVIAGPTAVGKTALGVSVCQTLDGEVVSCDSMQIYRGMNVGTAKVSTTEMQGIPHHLLDIVNPTDTYSVAQYQQDALRVIQDIIGRGKVPVMVGGTGLYINAVLYPMTFLDFDPEIRLRIQHDYQLLGAQAMYDRLTLLSPEMAAKLSPNDVKRVSRALELVAIGKAHHTQDMQQPRFDVALYVLSIDRAVLYNRIDRRVDEMINNGLLKEVQDLLSQGVSPQSQAFQAIAYKEFAAYLQKEIGYEEAVQLIKKRSRNYAKRQLTWLRQYPFARWLDATQDNTKRIVEDWNNG